MIISPALTKINSAIPVSSSRNLSRKSLFSEITFRNSLTRIMKCLLSLARFVNFVQGREGIDLVNPTSHSALTKNNSARHEIDPANLFAKKFIFRNHISQLVSEDYEMSCRRMKHSLLSLERFTDKVKQRTRERDRHPIQR